MRKQIHPAIEKLGITKRIGLAHCKVARTVTFLCEMFAEPGQK